ncbi:MAG: asparagine--tRNA ligase [Symbiobacteriaceae bacterium]|nr:asparagine--tRNA ligase [Symbiobacteriaceae bacterium]
MATPAKITPVRALYRDTGNFLGQEITLQGWVRTIRSSRTVGFIELNDGSFFENLQIVFNDSLPDFAEIAKYPIASALAVYGTLVATPGAQQPFELQATAVHLVASSDNEYPLQKKFHTVEFLRDIAHLRPRSSLFSAVFRVRSVVSYAIHRYFQELGFVYVHAPLITGSDAEGAGEMFTVTTIDAAKPPTLPSGGIDYTQDFFGKHTHLTVSGQMEAECFALAFRNVYTFGPTFRAENSNTTRHAAEFWMIEPEMAFADLEDNMVNIEGLVKAIVNAVLKECPEEVAYFSEVADKGLLERLQNVVNNEFARVSYTEAIDLLLASGATFEFPVFWGCDLKTEHERYLAETHFQRPVFVYNYPKEIKAFYMRLNDDGRTVAATDLLVPGVGEIVGASQREERLELLKQRITENGMPLDSYWWYLELRRYGGVYHSGYGLGLERMLMYVTGVSNIRDVIPFPRTVGNCW